MNKNFLTIFTPTYNRKETLPRLYDSLKRQTIKNFEWIIIDDESIDGTEELINQYLKENVITINYYKEKHGGKHRAINRALDVCKGNYFFIVDSDDYIVNNAVELIYNWIDTIKSDKICAVSGLRMNSKNQILGGIPKFKKNQEYIDVSNFNRERYLLNGDKSEIYRTKLLKENKFPEFDGEYFVTEDVVFQEIAAKGYLIRWFNEPIYICDYRDDGLTKGKANDIIGHKNNYKGYCYWVKRSLKLKPFRLKYRVIRDYLKTGRYLNKSFDDMAKDIDFNKRKLCLYFILQPISHITNIIHKLL